MNDLISRKQAIKEIYHKVREEENNAIPGEDLDVGVIVGLKMAVRIIKEQPPAEKTGKWVSCTERLPEEDGLYLVTHSYKYGNTDIAVNRVKIMLFWAKSKSWQVDGITAWMPLPQPYKGE